MNGVVYSLNKTKGELVSPQTPVAVIGDATNFILELQVDEYDILMVKNGLKVLVKLDSYKDKVFEAKVSRINPLMDERSKTFLVEAEFVVLPERLYPNITFEASILILSKSKAMLIPREYLLNDSMVLKVNGDTVFVKTGLKDYQKIEILSGITEEDELIRP
jgi:multidrug efflux pump subunit AcrA (membrane-fusion protein)